jgi:hypothetical protein
VERASPPVFLVPKTAGTLVLGRFGETTLPNTKATTWVGSALSGPVRLAKNGQTLETGGTPVPLCRVRSVLDLQSDLVRPARLNLKPHRMWLETLALILDTQKLSQGLA